MRRGARTRCSPSAATRTSPWRRTATCRCPCTRAGWRVTQDDEAIAFTEVPDNVDALLAQRTRWVFGTLQAIYKHRAMLFRRRYGLLGWYVLPSYVLSIVVPIVFLPFVAFMGSGRRRSRA